MLPYAIIWLILPVLIITVALAFMRLILGPSLPDRVVALDVLATLGIGIIVAYAVATDHPTLIDVAVVIALIAFLGTVAFAYYIQKGGSV